MGIGAITSMIGCPLPTALSLCPGVNDAAKRRLLVAAAAYLSGAGEAVEQQRLSECDVTVTVTAM